MVWDKEAVYDEQISPLMSQIIKICKDNKIPIVASFQIADSEEDGPLFCSTILPFEDICCKEIMELAYKAKPKPALVLAETTITNPNGTKSTTITRVK